MKTNMNILAASLLAAGLLTAAGHAAAIDEINFGLDTVAGGDTPANAGKPWVNAKFIDLGFLGAPGVIPGFAAFKNTVELQITTTNGRDPASGPAFTPDQLAGFGLSAYPDLGVVNGGGNLAAGEYVSTLYLNFNSNLDVSKLSLTWGGAPGFGFPAPGVEPISFVTSADGFDFGAVGKFDMAISFAAGALGPDGGFSSKLVFHYNGAPGSDENLDLGDFDQGAPGSGFKAMALLGGTSPDGFSGVVAVPEPSTYAMLGVGLAALCVVARRKARV